MLRLAVNSAGSAIVAWATENEIVADSGTILGGVDAPGQYDFVLSVLTLHHAPDLRAALSHIKALLAPCGRAVMMDVYPAESALRPPERCCAG